VAAFEISVNGKRRFSGEDVRAITLASDSATNHGIEKVYLHVGVGQAGEWEVQYLGGDLRPGDEISVRVLTDFESPTDADGRLQSCSFCGNNYRRIISLVAGPEAAICDGCIADFHAFIKHGAALPAGAYIQDGGEGRCGFCHKAPPEVPGLLARKGGAICPECLRACTDLIESSGQCVN
jgi:hypothetical protein